MYRYPAKQVQFFVYPAVGGPGKINPDSSWMYDTILVATDGSADANREATHALIGRTACR